MMVVTPVMVVMPVMMVMSPPVMVVVSTCVVMMVVVMMAPPVMMMVLHLRGHVHLSRRILDCGCPTNRSGDRPRSREGRKASGNEKSNKKLSH